MLATVLKVFEKHISFFLVIYFQCWQQPGRETEHECFLVPAFKTGGQAANNAFSNLSLVPSREDELAHPLLVLTVYSNIFSAVIQSTVDSVTPKMR